MVDTMQWIDVFEGVAHPEREILIEFRKDISTMGLSSQTSLIADIENRQNITIDEMMLDGTIAIASIAPSPTLTVAFISDGADYIGTIETESSKQQWMDVLRSDPRIVSVQSNFVYELASTDSTFESLNTASQLIPFSDIQTISPQVLSGSNTGIIVGVLDTGIAYNHPELIDKMWDGTRCVSDTGAPLGGCIHGYDFGEGDLDPTE